MIIAQLPEEFVSISEWNDALALWADFPTLKVGNGKGYFRMFFGDDFVNIESRLMKNSL